MNTITYQTEVPVIFPGQSLSCKKLSLSLRGSPVSVQIDTVPAIVRRVSQGN